MQNLGMKVVGLVLLFFLAVTLLVLLIAQTGLLRGPQPKDLGVHGGRLNPPSPHPNSVCSQTRLYPYHPQRDYAHIAPLRFQGDGASAMRRLAEIVRRLPRSTLVIHEPDYLYAHCRSRWLNSIDDLEFWFDPVVHAIQVRSASRLGRKDFQSNRKRVEKIRAQLLQS